MQNIRWLLPAMGMLAIGGLIGWKISRDAGGVGADGFESRSETANADHSDSSATYPTSEIETAVTPVKRPESVEKIAERLQRHQWPAKSIDAFLLLNGEWINRLATEQPERYQSLIDRLIRIEPSRRESAALGAVLADHPELAGCLSLMRPDSSCSFELPDHSTERTVFANCLVLAHDGPSARQFMHAWTRHNRTIGALWSLGLAGSERLFMFERRDEADQEYDRWLSAVFEAVADVSGKRPTKIGSDRYGPLLSRVCLVALNGEKIQQRLRSDAQFARTFRQELWPKLDRVSRRANRPLELFLQDDRIWQLLAMPQGEELASRYGMLPIEIFFGNRRLPDDLHARAADMLIEGRASCIFALLDVRLRSDSQFHLLLRNQSVPAASMAVAIEHLRQEGQAYRKKLGEYLAMQPEQLIKEMEAPYDVESWDDSLPAYLKYAKRFALREQQDAGDFSQAIAVGFEHLGTVIEYVGEPIGEYSGYPIVGKAASWAGTGVSAAASYGGQWATEGVNRRKAAYATAAQGIHPQQVTDVTADQALLLTNTRLMQTLSEIQLLEPTLDPRLTWKSYCFFANSTPAGKRHLARLEKRLRFVVSSRNELIPWTAETTPVTDLNLSPESCQRAQSIWWLECLTRD